MILDTDTAGRSFDGRIRKPTEFVALDAPFVDCENDVNELNGCSICFICLRCQYIAPIIIQTIAKTETPTPIIT